MIFFKSRMIILISLLALATTIIVVFALSVVSQTEISAPVSVQTVQEPTNLQDDKIAETDEVKPLAVAQQLENNSSELLVNHEGSEVKVAKSSLPLPNWYLTVLVLMTITAFCSVSVSAWLYLWRVKITKNHALLVPENLIKATEKHSALITALQNDIPQIMHSVDQRSSDTLSSSQNIEETLVRFQSALKDRDQEISRYKSGHDVFVYRRFLLRFLSVYQMLTNDEFSSPEIQGQLSKIRVYFEDAFEECGVELYSPKIGINFLEHNNLFDESISQIETDNIDRDYEIAEIIRPGLRVIENPSEIIVKARAKILRYKG